MESLLNCCVQVLIISFALVMMLDFIGGAIHLFNSSAPAQIKPHAEPETESAMPVRACPTGIVSSSGHLTILPEDNGEPQIPTPLEIAGWDVVEPVGSEPATLEWLETAINPNILNTAEQPNIIEMACVRQLKAKVLSSRQPEQDLTKQGIRELKKLARAAKIKRYSVMTKIQLIDQLTATCSELKTETLRTAFKAFLKPH